MVDGRSPPRIVPGKQRSRNFHAIGWQVSSPDTCRFLFLGANLKPGLGRIASVCLPWHTFYQKLHTGDVIRMSEPKVIRGKAYILGDDIDTDQIIPAEHLVYSLDDPEESKKYGSFALSGVPLAQAGLPEGGTPFVKNGEWQSTFRIIIGGKNFGCGSSREHAPYALNKAGALAVVATSYARIFYRNSINGGYLIPATSREDLSRIYRTGDEVELDTAGGVVRNISQGLTHELVPLGDVAAIIEAGNVFEYAKRMGMIATA